MSGIGKIDIVLSTAVLIRMIVGLIFLLALLPPPSPLVTTS